MKVWVLFIVHTNMKDVLGVYDDELKALEAKDALISGSSGSSDISKCLGISEQMVL